MATRGETILAALNLVQKLNKTNEIDRLKHELNKVINYCTQLQVKQDVVFNSLNIKGGITKAKYKNNIRIDFVQHVLQVLLGYEE